MGREGADRFFGEAANLLPTLSVLARRHEDPEDDFTLDDFVASDIHSDPLQARRMRRLVRQEQSQFANITGSLRYRQDQRTGLRTGLTSI